MYSFVCIAKSTKCKMYKRATSRRRNRVPRASHPRPSRPSIQRVQPDRRSDEPKHHPKKCQSSRAVQRRLIHPVHPSFLSRPHRPRAFARGRLFPRRRVRLPHRVLPVRSRAHAILLRRGIQVPERGIRASRARVARVRRRFRVRALRFQSRLEGFDRVSVVARRADARAGRARAAARATSDDFDDGDGDEGAAGFDFYVTTLSTMRSRKRPCVALDVESTTRYPRLVSAAIRARASPPSRAPRRRPRARRRDAWTMKTKTRRRRLSSSWRRSARRRRARAGRTRMECEVYSRRETCDAGRRCWRRRSTRTPWWTTRAETRRGRGNWREDSSKNDDARRRISCGATCRVYRKWVMDRRSGWRTTRGASRRYATSGIAPKPSRI
mmetsp:Transcript_6824/g.27397  ORF Transcript_6824/g.27397 Transcript_6824/m.27397 type:complete len:383 (-) Transcript_6824:2337-3485(-)